MATGRPAPLPHEMPPQRGLPRPSGRLLPLPDYGPSTPQKQAAASRWIARDIARRRLKRPSIVSIPRGGGGTNVYDRDLLIGQTSALPPDYTGVVEQTQISRVKPRRLGNPRIR